ncbi:TonB-linked SusC/RagA family outer membrane protein [Algoriphagus sp. 4150]|uniref:SusC/RagA family TonB-linked outer membrane protein n=1 Tax=Algoriphagus sp. 4150 TaxID=2817756 RepID=UPI0028665E52|nr:TonB-dependent receptor [Algoriphagus sp. 4150]MDR7128726.1 TonB-linked SusC/RagA family outer membrane protein [Algoriphagus sp. 4150]
MTHATQTYEGRVFNSLSSALKIPLLIVVYLMAHAAVLAQSTIRGTVTDDTSVGLPGATIMLKGTSTGTTSDVDGNFSIEVPGQNAVLVFSFIGYQTQEIPVANQSVINVQLNPSTESLEEVIVVGYGTQREEAVTGSVASVSGDIIREIPSANITTAMQGRLPGVEFSQTSTRPGAAMQIRIRGSRSLNASNDPLIVLDGIPFPGSISDINPNDIKSIDILKDASATAIYGSRGANGVVLVTTNRGSKGQKPTVNYNGFYGPQTVFAKFPMMNNEEFVALRKEAGLFSNGPDESDAVNTDWQDMLYKTGSLSSHDVSVAGGTEGGNYNVGIGYLQDKGVIPSQQYSRIALRASVDQQVGKYFRFGLTTNNNYNITEGGQVGLGLLGFTPISDPYQADGSWKRIIRSAQDDSWVYSREIVENLEDQWLSESRAFASYNSIFAEVKIPGVEGLKYRTNLGLDYRQVNGGSFTAQGVNNVSPETPSSATVSNSHNYHWVFENLITYDKAFGKHLFNVVGLYSAEQNTFNRSQMGARDIPAEAFQFYNIGAADGELIINPADQQYQQWGLMSWMGRVMYSYDDKYMLSATLRSDGSSRLAEGYKWHTYPAISAGWNLAKESFLSNSATINLLKLRVGYGQTSNQAIAPYATLGELATRPYNFGDDTYTTGFYVSQLPNSNLGWEYSETWNFGVDFGLFNERLSGTLEYYLTKTNNILLNVNLPSTSGVGSYTANIGETQNKGIEFSLNGAIIQNSNGWSWDVGVNIYGNQNKLLSLASGQQRDESNWWFVGQPIDVIYDFKKVGLWQEGDPHLDILEPGGNVGMIKVKYNGPYDSEGVPTRQIGPDDREAMSVLPDFQGGFNTRVAYKGLDLNIVGAFKSGGVLISTLHSASGYLNMLSGRRNNVKVDYWTPENTDAAYPKPGGIISGDNPKYGSTLGYFDASYVKIRNISLGYNFNQTMLDNVGIDRLRVYFSVQNPWVISSPFHKETGLDPETNSYGDENAAVTTAYQPRLLTLGTNAPAIRNFLFGINLTF